MVEVLYKIRGMVPVYTKHTIHGKSLTAAPTLIPPRQEYLTSPDINLANALKNYDNTVSELVYCSTNHARESYNVIFIKK